jgi:hypothetical protein
MTQLGKLERIANIRTVWPDEARNFTPWLARPENLSALSDALGFGPDGFELEEVERGVGSFSADIVCRSTAPDGGHILIENMFGRSDHDHVGKILTYASGVRAKTVVLIAEEIREEHRAALDWLNSISDDDHAFFACQIELWRIGNSDPAPRFNLVVEPNDWSREFVKIPKTGETGELYTRYWTAFGQFLKDRKGPLRPQKGGPQHWMNISIGRSHFGLAAIASMQKGFLRVEMNFTGPTSHKAYFKLLESRDEIDRAFGEPLEWDQKDGRNQAKASKTFEGVQTRNEQDWGNQHRLLAEKLEALYRAFHERVKNLVFEEGEQDEV